MINQINSSSGLAYQPENSQKAASKKQEKKDGTYDTAFSVDISSSSSGETKGRKLTTDEIESIKNQTDASASALKDIVEKLIVQQRDKSPSFTLNIEILVKGDTAVQPAEPAEATEAAADSDWGVEAVSDRILSFAKSISGGDASKIEMLREAIDKGFASAKKTLGGKLPDISMQTYDAVMSKLDDWAGETDAAAAEAE